MTMKYQTPPGFRDRLSKDVMKKEALQRRLMDVYARFGFEPVSTPAIEYYQTYAAAFSTLQDRQMFKLIDSSQDILALRLDMTVPIARMAAGMNENVLPMRFSYCSEVWKVRRALAGKPSQQTDCGVEMIGTDSDEEILLLALQAMEAIGLQGWRLELQDARLFSTAAHLVFDDEDKISLLQDLVDRKSMVELEEFLVREKLGEKAFDFFMNLPLLFGSERVLNEAEELAFDDSLVEILEALRDTWAFLKRLGYGQEISVDLSKLPHFNYYTGLVFEGFVPGPGSSVLSGGRYDSLMETFGRNLPASGFSVKVDTLLDWLPEVPRRKKAVLRYPSSLQLEAFLKADQLRRMGCIVLEKDDTLQGMELMEMDV